MNQAVVQQLLVDIEGRTTKLEEALRAAESRTKKFESETTQSLAKTGKAADDLGNKYAGSARQMASAAEAVARSGELTAASTKQIITQGSMMAGMFGPTGAIVGAVGIGLMAVVGFFTRTRDEARRLADEVLTLQGKMRGASSPTQVAGEIEKHLRGDVTLPRPDGLDRNPEQYYRAMGIQGLEAKLEELEERAAELRRQAAEQTGARGRDAVTPVVQELGTAERLIDRYRAQLATLAPVMERDLIPALQRTAKAQADASRTLGEWSAGKAADAKVTQEQLDADIRAAAERQRLRDQEADALQKFIAAREATAQTLEKQFAQALVKSTATLTDDLHAEFDAIRARYQEAADLASAAGDVGRAETFSGAVVQFTAWRDSAIATQAALEASAKAQREIEQNIFHTAERYAALNRIVEGHQDDLEHLELTDADREKIQKRINELLAEMAGLLPGIADVTGGVRDATEDILAKATEHARVLRDSADGALQLAAALGLVDERSATILRNIVQVSAGIGPLAKALQGAPDPKTGVTAVSAAAVAGAALPVVGAIAGLAKSIYDDGRARKEELRHLRQALGTLTESIRNQRVLESLRGPAQEEERARQDFYASAKQLYDNMIEQAKRSGAPAILPSWEELSAMEPGDMMGQFQEWISQTSRPGGIAKMFPGLTEAFLRFEEMSKRIAERVALERAALDNEMEVIKARLAGDEDRAAYLAYENQLQSDLAAKKESGIYTEEQLLELEALQQQLLTQFLERQEEAREAAAAAAEREAQARLRARERSVLDAELDLFEITDPSERIQRYIGFYAKMFPELASLLDDFDLSTAEGVDQFTARLQALFSGLDPENLPEGWDDEMFHEFIRALLEIDGAANDAAKGIKSAADILRDAARQLADEFTIYGTSSADQARKLAELYGFDLGDISTEAGRAQAIEALQRLYEANKDNPDVVDGIKAVLSALRGIDYDSGASFAGIGDRGTTTRANTQGWAGVTAVSFDRHLDFQRQIARNTRDIAVAVLRTALAAPPPMTFPVPPSYTDAIGGSRSAGGVAGTAQYVTINAHIHVSLPTAAGNPTVVGAQTGTAAAEAFTREMNESAMRQKIRSALLAGVIRVQH